MDYTSDFWTPENKILYPIDAPSDLMWASLFYFHPTKSPIFHLSPKERLKSIQTNILPTYTPDLSDEIKLLFLDKNEILLSNWEHKLHERDAFIKSLSYNLDTYKVLDALMESTPAMWKQYHQIKSLIEREGTSEHLSLLEKDAI